MQVRTPASISSIMDLSTPGRQQSAMLRKIMVHQWRYGLSAEAYDENGPLAVLIFYAISEGELEMASLFSPRAGDHILPLMRLAHLTIEKMADDTGTEITCVVRRDGRSGARMAKLLGFVEQSKGENARRFIWRKP